MTHPALQTPVCEILGIEYPIIQAGMGFIARGELAAAVSQKMMAVQSLPHSILAVVWY